MDLVKHLERGACDQRPAEGLRDYIARLERMDLRGYSEDAWTIRALRLAFAEQELRERDRPTEFASHSDKQTRVLRLPRLPRL